MRYGFLTILIAISNVVTAQEGNVDEKLFIDSLQNYHLRLVNDSSFHFSSMDGWCATWFEEQGKYSVQKDTLILFGYIKYDAKPLLVSQISGNQNELKIRIIDERDLPVEALEVNLFLGSKDDSIKLFTNKKGEILFQLYPDSNEITLRHLNVLNPINETFFENVEIDIQTRLIIIQIDLHPNKWELNQFEKLIFRNNTLLSISSNTLGFDMIPKGLVLKRKYE